MGRSVEEVKPLARGRRLAMIAGPVVLALVFVPPLRARAKAGPVLAEAMGLPSARPLAAPVEMVPDELAGAAGHRYHPGWNAPGVVLVPGATRAGLGDARVVRAARAIASTGRTVFVPELDLYRRTFSDADLARIAASVSGLAERTGARVGMIGFSYGGSLAIVASARVRAAEVLTHIAVFGAYYDLPGVIQAATTGQSVVDGRRMTWSAAAPEAREIFLDVVTGLAPAGEEEALAAAVRGDIGRQELSRDARSLYDLVVNEDPDRSEDLVEALPDHLRDLLRRFSPGSVAAAVRVPVVVLHSRDDPAVPYAEGLRLAAGLPDARLSSVDIFTHVDLARRSPVGWISAAPDLVRAWCFAGRALGPQEPVVPPLLRRLAP